MYTHPVTSQMPFFVEIYSFKHKMFFFLLIRKGGGDAFL